MAKLYHKVGSYELALDYHQKALAACVPGFRSTDRYSLPPLKKVISKTELIWILNSKSETLLLLANQNPSLEKVLPAAFGSDIGAIWKPTPRIWLNTALWYLRLQQEFVYVGDEGGGRGQVNEEAGQDAEAYGHALA